MNTITTYRPKMNPMHINSALTWVNESNDLPSTWTNLEKWVKIAPNVYVMGESEPMKVDGMFWVKTERKTLRAMLGFYLSRIPGREIVLIADPTTEIGGRIDDLLDFVERGKMELAWGSFARAKNDLDGAPKAFIMSAVVLNYLMQTLPESLTLEGSEWASWMHDNLGRLIIRPRYFDATEFDIVKAKPVEVVNAYEISPEIPPPVKDTKFKKRKK